MIVINDGPADISELLQEYKENSTERQALQTLDGSIQTYSFFSLERLQFELLLRREIVSAAYALSKSKLSFQTFRDSTCNTDYWDRKADGGFALKAGIKPADAVRDIYQNSSKYGTECATAMLIVYYKALLELFPEKTYNDMFPDIYLMNWHRIEANLREVGLLQQTDDYLPGDRRYFMNPDVDPETPELQGENVIDLGNGKYYGHGLGIHRAETFIELLNQNRKDDPEQSAFLMTDVGRPDFNRLAYLYEQAVPASLFPSA